MSEVQVAEGTGKVARFTNPGEAMVWDPRCERKSSDQLY